MHEKDEMITVHAEPLRRVLAALLGPAHYVRELQATRNPPALFPENPINQLVNEYNFWLESKK